MTFYVKKSLANGSIRFGVSPRREITDVDDDPALSTGPAGEFVRRRGEGYFLATPRALDDPELPNVPGISSTPFLSSLVDGTRRGWGYVAMMIAGLLLVLIGISVIVTKGPQGWVEVILGVALIATPIVMTAAVRKQIREKEERERAARAEQAWRNREMLAAYLAALDRLRREGSDTALRAVEHERQALTIPYTAWSPAARVTVLTLGLEALARAGSDRAAEARAVMDRVGAAAGLTAEDAQATRRDLYDILVWHLLADDRVGKVQQQTLAKIREGLGVAEADAAEANAAAEFGRLRGINRDTLPKRAPAVSVPLQFRERPLHVTGGETVERRRRRKSSELEIVTKEPCSVIVTNKRIIIQGRRTQEYSIVFVDDVEADLDANVLTVGVAREKQPLLLRVPDPIYTAAMIDIATTMTDKPKGFA